MAQTVKTLPAIREIRVQSLGWEDPLEKEMQPTPLFFAGESHRQRSLAGYSPWGHTRLKQLGTQGLNEILFLVIPHGLQDLNPPTWDLNLGHSRESPKS